MRHQLSFADSEYQHKRHQTRKEKLLERMKTLALWKLMVPVIVTPNLAVVADRIP